MRTLARIPIIIFAAFLAAPAFAQQPELQKMSVDATEIILKKKRSRVLVADFTGPGERVSELGRQLADEFSRALGNTGRGLEVLPRTGLLASWSRQLGESSDLREGRLAGLLADMSEAHVVIAGEIKKKKEELQIQIRIWDTRPLGLGFRVLPAHGFDKLATLRTRIPLTTDKAEMLARPLPAPEEGFLQLTAGLGRSVPIKTYPKCRSCPRPNFSDDFKGRFNVTVEVTVTTEGHPANIVLKQGSGRGDSIDQKIVETVGQWSFDPAVGANGQPINTRIPIHIEISPRPEGQNQGQGVWLGSVPSSEKSISDACADFPKSGTNGLSHFQCVDCPNASFTVAARKHKGNFFYKVVLAVFVSTEGRIQQAIPLSEAPFGLTQAAVEAAMKWKLKPARDANGKAVAACGPVEMTFHKY